MYCLSQPHVKTKPNLGVSLLHLYPEALNCYYMETAERDLPVHAGVKPSYRGQQHLGERSTLGVLKLHFAASLPPSTQSG